MKRILSSVMSKETGIMVIIGICLLVLFIGILKQRADLVLNFVVRMAAGAVAIVFCNQLLSKNGIDIMVGLNPWSLQRWDCWEQEDLPCFMELWHIV